MKHLREWSGRRVATVSLAWVLGVPILAAPAVFGAVGWLARTEAERTGAAIPDSLAPALRVDYLPREAGDFSISFANPGVMVALALLLLPPLALCLAWLVARRSRFEQSARL